MDVALCECGCGRPAPIIRAHDRARGYVKGQPHRFVAGHQGRGKPMGDTQRAGLFAALKGHVVSAETRKQRSDGNTAAWSRGLRSPTKAFVRWNTGRTRELSPSGKGGKTRMPNGSIGHSAPEHPRAHPNGSVYEHIVVAEKTVGRPLADKEVVHHPDRDRHTHRPTNLIVLASQADHLRLHRRLGHVD